MNPKTYLILDKPREVRWTKIAQARLARIDYSFSQAIRDLGSRRKFLYALCALHWSALVDLDHPWTHPEELAEHFDTDQKIDRALNAIDEILTEAGLIKVSKKNESPAPDTSQPGPQPSSSSELPAPTTASSPTLRSGPSTAPSGSESGGPTPGLPGSSAP